MSDVDSLANELTPILPPGDIEIDFDTINCIPGMGSQSSSFCLCNIFSAIDGQEVDIVEDNELVKDVFEIGDQSSISFPASSNLPIFVTFIKNTGRFLEVAVRVLDSEGVNRKITMSNKRSTIAVNKDTCNLPLQIDHGWQYLNVDLNNICKRCFGTQFISCVDIRIGGPARVAKIYFESVDHADAELPMYLRVIS